MKSRSTLAVLVMGIVAVAAMGLMTQFVVDSNPNLVHLGKLKEALAEGFAGRGVEKISVKALPGRRGYELLVKGSGFSSVDRETLGKEIAVFYLQEFEGQRKPIVKIALIDESGWGCRAQTVLFEKEFLVQRLDLERQLLVSLEKFEGQEDPTTRLRVASARMVDLTELKIEVVTAETAESLEAEDIDLIFDEAQSFVWRALRAPSVRWITLVVRSSPASANETVSQSPETQTSDGPTSDIQSRVLKEARVERPTRSNRQRNRDVRMRGTAPNPR